MPSFLKVPSSNWCCSMLEISVIDYSLVFHSNCQLTAERISYITVHTTSFPHIFDLIQEMTYLITNYHPLKGLTVILLVLFPLVYANHPVDLCASSVSLMNCNAKDVGKPGIKCPELHWCGKCRGFPEYLLSLTAGPLNMKEFLCCVYYGNVAGMNAFKEVLREKRKYRATKQCITGFAKNENHGQPEFDKEQVR